MKRRSIFGILGLGLLVAVAGYFLFLRAPHSSNPVESYRAASTPESKKEILFQILKDRVQRETLLKELFKQGDESDSQVFLAVIADHPDLSEADKKSLYCSLARESTAFSDEAKSCLLAMLPKILATGHDEQVQQSSRELVQQSLLGRSVTLKLSAIRWAMNSEINSASAVKPLLSDSDPAVRRAVLLVLGPEMTTNPVLSVEELFSVLHDDDVEARDLALRALQARGLEWKVISAGRKLTDPQASVRLELLQDLLNDRETFRDPSPWLMKLAQEKDPAFRAAVLRVACERQLSFNEWVVDLATTDPDEQVRRVGQYYLRKHYPDIKLTMGQH